MLNGTGDRTIGYALCPQCERVMRRTDAKVVALAGPVEFHCPTCPNMTVSCAMTTEDDQPIRLDWSFCTIDKWQPPALSPAERMQRDIEFHASRSRLNHTRGTRT
jgi:hypothetical protein